MKTKRTQVEVKLKDGGVIPVGTVAQFIGHESLCRVHLNGRDYHIRIRNAFKRPSERVMLRWTLDGVARTITGDRIEPDGMKDGVPSWLLAMGIM